MTQCEQVLLTLARFGSITPLDAMKDFGVMRLGARIFDLKAQGWHIESETVASQNRWYKTVHYSRYTMTPEERLRAADIFKR